ERGGRGERVRALGVPGVVGINRFSADTDLELATVRQACAELGVEAIECTHWADGSAGTEKLANAVVKLAESGKANFRYLYPDDPPFPHKSPTTPHTLSPPHATTPSTTIP